jgi:hypothetical protein
LIRVSGAALREGTAGDAFTSASVGVAGIGAAVVGMMWFRVRTVSALAEEMKGKERKQEITK